MVRTEEGAMEDRVDAGGCGKTKVIGNLSHASNDLKRPKIALGKLGVHSDMHGTLPEWA